MKVYTLVEKLKLLADEIVSIERVTSNHYHATLKNNFTVDFKLEIKNYRVDLDIIMNDRPFYTGIEVTTGIVEFYTGLQTLHYQLINNKQGGITDKNCEFWGQL